MKNQIYLYNSINNYHIVEEMRNEITMWYVAGSLLKQFYLSKRIGLFGALKFKKGFSQKIGGNAEILDLCSGPATFTNYLSLIIPNLKALCVDMDERFLNFGKKHFPRWKFQKHDALLMKLPKKFEVICISSGYHHIRDSEKVKFLKNVKKHLTRNGIILICENFISHYDNSQERKRAIEKYYKALESYYRQGHGSPRAVESLSEVRQRDLNQIEEYKVSFEIFKKQIKFVGLRLDQDVNVWRPFRTEDAGSHVMIIKNEK